jgi:uncharacterized membrane-anchored protein YhcB (DUF1043 family)
MQENKNNFYSLVSGVMKLEVIHETQQEEYNHLNYLYIAFGKDNRNSMDSAKYQCDTAKKQIDEIIKEISLLQLDSNMQEYYKLYKEKSDLLQKIWVCETEIGYIGAKLIFDCICDDEVDKEMADKRNQFEEQKKVATEKMKEVVLKMIKICPA